MKYHIIGINQSTINTYKFLKKNYFETTISDHKKFIDLKKKLKNIKSLKNFFFSDHPKKEIKNSNFIVYASGVIKNSLNYRKYIGNRKNISEIDFFYKHNNWPSKNILIITGSRGKSTVAKIIKNKLNRKKIFKKIIFMDRKNINFSNIPKYRPGYFLIIEMDYQSLLIAKKISAKFRIITSYFKIEDKVFRNEKLYKFTKLKIFNNTKKNEFAFLNKKTYLKLKNRIKKLKKKITIIKTDKTIQYNNNLLSNEVINKIAETFSE